MKSLVSFSVFMTVLVVSQPSWAIKKCQDSNGKWHYGDIAVAECENSKVTTLTDRGFVKEELDAPKSKEEIRAAEEEFALVEQARLERLAEQEEKRRILSIYETEDDIDRQRDNQVRSVQSNIDVHKSYLKNMEKRLARFQSQLEKVENKNTKKSLTEKIAEADRRMDEYSEQLIRLEAQKVEILDRFKQERATYLSLKNIGK